MTRKRGKRETPKTPKTFVYAERKKLDKEKGDAMIVRLTLLSQHVEAALKRAQKSLEELRSACGRI